MEKSQLMGGDLENNICQGADRTLLKKVKEQIYGETAKDVLPIPSKTSHYLLV